MNPSVLAAALNPFLPIVVALVAVTTLIFGVRTYRLNGRTKVAEFLLKLHQSFYVDATYVKMRQTLDDDSAPGAETITAVVKQEGVEFTDFLNFFELVAYMKQRGDLRQPDVNALFGYYLRILTTNADIHGYIRNKSKSFEHLNGLLTEFEARKIGASVG